MNIPFVDVTTMSAAQEEEIISAVTTILKRGDYILGAAVSAFEEAFAAYCEAKFAVGVANGTDAITLAAQALGLKEGDEVIIPANTFIATAEGLAHAGVRPVLVDADPTTYTIDVRQIEAKITKKTKALVAVHLFGQPVDFDPLAAIAKKYNLAIIEDAAQAHGADYKGRRIGSLGDIACFSFYPSKNLGACGDAGAIVTNREDLAVTVKKLRDHGSAKKYHHELIGYNSRLDTIQAAVLLLKLKYLDAGNLQRREHAQTFHEHLSTIPGVHTPQAVPDRNHVYHVYAIRLSGINRDQLAAELLKQGIHSNIHYPFPVHLAPAFAYLNGRKGDFPVAEACSNELLSLPMYPQLTREKIAYIAEHIKNFCRRTRDVSN